MSQAVSVVPLANGYQVEFPISALSLVAEFTDGERLCCPFLHFTIQVEASAETLHFQLTGGEGVKIFLEQELLPHLPLAPEQ